MKNIWSKFILIFGLVSLFGVNESIQSANDKQPEYDFSGWCEDPGTGCIHIDLETVVITTKK